MSDDGPEENYTPSASQGTGDQLLSQDENRDGVHDITGMTEAEAEAALEPELKKRLGALGGGKSSSGAGSAAGADPMVTFHKLMRNPLILNSLKELSSFLAEYGKDLGGNGGPFGLLGAFIAGMVIEIESPSKSTLGSATKAVQKQLPPGGQGGMWEDLSKMMDSASSPEEAANLLQAAGTQATGAPGTLLGNSALEGAPDRQKQTAVG